MRDASERWNIKSKKFLANQKNEFKIIIIFLINLKLINQPFMKVRLLITFILFLNQSFAQKINTTFIPISESDKKSIYLISIGKNYFGFDFDFKNNSGLQVRFKNAKHSISLQKYDEKINLVSNIELSNNEKIYGPYSPILFAIKEQLILLYMVNDNENNSIKVCASKINTTTLSLENKIDILSIDKISNNFFPSGYTKNEYLQITKSPDNNKILITFGEKNDKRFYYSVIDSSLKKIRNGISEFSDKKEITFYNRLINNQSDFFVTYKYINGKKFNGSVYINKASKEQKTIEIEDPNIEIYEIFISPIDNSDYAIIGTGKENNDFINTIFYQKVDNVGNVKGKISKTNVPEDIVEKLGVIGFANTKKKNFGILNIEMKPYQLENGYIGLVGQCYENRWTTNSSFHIFGNIVNIQFKNEIATFSMSPKLRVSAGNLVGSGIFPVALKNELVVFYNDHKENLIRNIEEEPFRSDVYKNHVLVAAHFKDDKVITREIIADLSDENFLSNPDLGYENFEKIYILPFIKIGNTGGGKNGKRFAKLVFE